MIASRANIEEWMSEYHEVCLQHCELGDAIELGQPHIRAVWATRTSDPGAGIAVTHYLLNLPRRAHRRR
jgi:hypothetical protein